MGILAWIVLGLLAGWIAGMVMKGSGYGIIGDIVLGVLGALIGGFVAGQVLGIADVTGLNISSLIVAVLGAIVLIAISRAVSGSRRRSVS